jgi:hypothetical protein
MQNGTCETSEMGLRVERQEYGRLWKAVIEVGLGVDSKTKSSAKDHSVHLNSANIFR